MTALEREVWAAVYATAWTASREAQRKYGDERSEAAIAAAARDEAWTAIEALRQVFDEQTLEAA